MKVFISQHPDLRVYGLAQALRTVIPHTFLWNDQEMPLFDLMQDQKPDILFYHDRDALDRSIELAQKEFPDTKFVFFQFQPTLSTATPNLRIGMTDEVSNGADIMMGYSTDMVDMTGGQEAPSFLTDVVAITDNTDIKNEFEMLALRVLSHQFQTKIYGNTRVPIPNYLGQLRPDDYKKAFASAKVFVSFDEQRVNDACYNNCTPLIFSRQKKEEHNFSSIEELIEKCQEAIKGKELLADKVVMAYQDTYHHTLSEIFDKLGLEELREITKQRIYQYDRRDC